MVMMLATPQHYCSQQLGSLALFAEDAMAGLDGMSGGGGGDGLDASWSSVGGESHWLPWRTYAAVEL